MSDDTISRQAAIDAVDKYIGKFDCIDANFLDGLKTAKKLMMKLMMQMPSAQQWIPVSERLPKPVALSQKREWFITSNQYGGVTLTCYEFEASPFKEGWQTDMTILAWMPLPKPWRGEEDERMEV